jgi:hypothetical protein
MICRQTLGKRSGEKLQYYLNIKLGSLASF